MTERGPRRIKEIHLIERIETSLYTGTFTLLTFESKKYISSRELKRW
ncbi:hypothetical protein SAMN06265361_103264 [Laceyella tengchongensis]|uniref:Uncharacterized protein n=1 Tax=Laceyella tengchongensis TaxID=574699 RepID=A0AA45WNY4_9BACL|nr:hypothetical protein SAMN06265361_103264 [Laceyella tengchongensis]